MDAIKFLKRQHDEVEKLFKRYERSPQEGRNLFGLVERALVPHAIIEEMHLYPLVRERVQGGERLAEHALHEHQEVEAALDKVGTLIADDMPFEITMKRIVDMVREHVREEEAADGLFGRLRAALSQRELDELGQALERSWSMTPTRAHPLAPDRPPANLVLGVPLAVVDRVRDRISGRAEAAEPAEKRVLRASRRPARRKRRAATRKTRSRTGSKRGRTTAKRAAPRRRKTATRQRARSRTVKARRR